MSPPPVADLTGVIDDLVVGDGRKLQNMSSMTAASQAWSAHTIPMKAASLIGVSTTLLCQISSKDRVSLTPRQSKDSSLMRTTFGSRSISGKCLVKCVSVFDEGHDSKMRD
jgi:hypothetical protein